MVIWLVVRTITPLTIRNKRFFLNQNTMSLLANGPDRSPRVPPGPKTTMTVVLGAQWGDEGKGKLVDILATKADLVCRCQGGNNAGHTVVVRDKHYDFHILPSGLINPKAMNVIGNGVVVHVPQLFEELEKNEAKGITDWKERLLVSDRAHLVFDLHQSADAMREGGKGSLGTTKKGIGPAYASKAQRHGLRIADLIGNYNVFSERFRDLVSFYKKVFPDLSIDVENELEKYKVYAEKLRPIVCDTVEYVNKALQDKNMNIVVEGANATMLDIDFGTYPYVTSSNCSIGAVCTGLGIPPRAIGDVYGVTKAYTTRVGIGAFPTELDNEIGEDLRNRGHEYGVTTKRPRRCGWLDIVMIKFVHMINGFTSLVVGKVDVLDTFDEVKIGVAYKHKGKILTSYPSTQEVLSEVEVEYITLPGWKTSLVQCRTFADLPPNAQAFVKKIEELSEIPVQWVGVGQSRDAMIKVY